MAITVMPDGIWAPWGRLGKTLETDFRGGTTLDDWIDRPTTGTDAGAGISAVTTGGGGVRITTAATTGLTATLTGPAVDLSTTGLAAVRMDLIWKRNAGLARIGFFDASRTMGGWMETPAQSAGEASLHAVASGVETSAATFFRNAGGTRWPLTLILTPDDGMLAVGEGDSIFAHQDFSAAMDLGTVLPTIQIEADADSGQSLDVWQWRIERWWV